MPNLHAEAVHAFWDSYDRKTLYRIIVALEEAESGAMDQVPEIEPWILRLGDALDNASGFELSQEAVWSRILAQTHAGRALRMLQALDMLKPGSASQLLMYAEGASETTSGAVPDPHAQIFLKRNLVFERLQLLSRIFAPYRISLVLKALEANHE